MNCCELVKRQVRKGKGLGRRYIKRRHAQKTPLIERRYNLSNMRVGNDLYVLQLIEGMCVDANTSGTISYFGYVIFAERPIVEGPTQGKIDECFQRVSILGGRLEFAKTECARDDGAFGMVAGVPHFHIAFLVAMGRNALETIHLVFVGVAQVPERALHVLARCGDYRCEARCIHFQLIVGQRCYAQVFSPRAAELHLIEVHV